MNSTQKSRKLQDDGERMIPEFHKNNIMYGEHLGRYLSVLKVINGLTVLDIASGSGYGTELMAGHAKFVYGVDIDKQAVAYSKANYQKQNIEYLVGSGTSIPLGDGTVDCVVSMETIEHIEDQETFLSEIKRVLKPGGWMILSTPNDKVYPKGNHFHVREHNKASLTALIKGCFKNTRMCYQVVSIAASVLHEKDLMTDNINADWRLEKLYKSQPDDSIYYLVVCGDGKLPDIENNTLLSQEFSHQEQKRIADYIGGLHGRVNDLRLNLEHELGEARRLTAELEQSQKELQALKSSSWWKLRGKVIRARKTVKRMIRG